MIVLEIAGIQLDLSQSTSPEYPRNQIEVATLVHTAAGGVSSRGTRYEPKYIWTFNLNISNDESLLLSLIYKEHETRRRTSQNADVILFDKSELFVERAPRTRPIFFGTLETLYPPGATTGNHTHTAYYAVFNAWFVQEPRYTATRSDSARKVSFTMQESSKRLA